MSHSKVALNFTQIREGTPNWALFLVQLFPVAPIAMMLVWLAMAYLLEATGVLRGLKIPPSLGDVESDVEGALTLLLSSFIAGLGMGRVWPSLKVSGRWVFLPSLVVAVGFILRWQQYTLYNSRDSTFRTVLAWLCDPSMYIVYGYLGYSLAMAVLVRRERSLEQ